ncbi:MAG: hypothetical protein NVS9B15_13430 [Acidobacteriaceae bacterium]
MFAAGGVRPLILCVDDEEAALTLRKMVLQKNGFEVLTATNSTDALQLMRENKVNMVVTDHLLGKESGVELAKEIKSLAPTIPVVLLSGLPPEHYEHVDCFISKGEPMTVVLSMLNDLLAR